MKVPYQLRWMGILIIMTRIMVLPPVHGHLQTAYEQVIGPWDIQLHTIQSQAFINTLVFTPSLHSLTPSHPSSDSSSSAVTSTSHSESSTSSNNILSSMSMLFPWKVKSSSFNKIKCVLDIRPDGTFTIQQKESMADMNRSQPAQQQHFHPCKDTKSSISKKSLMSPTSSSSSLTSTSSSSYESEIPTVIRGYWTIQPNPYCVTDRLYDELYMVSQPRVFIQTLVNKEEKNSIYGGLMIQNQSSFFLSWLGNTQQRLRSMKHKKNPVQAHAILEFRSRVWGRYSSSSYHHPREEKDDMTTNHRRRRNVPRLTHGICTLIMEQQNYPKEENRLRNIQVKNKDDEDTRILSSHTWIVGSFRGSTSQRIVPHIPSCIMDYKQNPKDDLYDYYNLDE